MRNAIIIIITCLFLYSCNGRLNGHPGNPSLINAVGTTLQSRIKVPLGYARVAEPQGSFAAYLRDTHLKPNGAVVHYYDGSEKKNWGVYVAVEDVAIGNKNLLQCADAVMCQRAMYLFTSGRKEEIGFTFTSGFRANYSKWMQGYRIALKGNDATWVKEAQPDTSFSNFKQYLEIIYSYCGTLSLNKELKGIDYKDIQPGDVLIIGGSPGHAELVMDMAVNKQGKKLYLLSQGYMPAQEIQILANPNNEGLSPWYEVNAGEAIIQTPEYKFTTANLKRF